MAILAERFVKMELGVELPKWKYQDLAQEQEERAAEVTPIAEKLLDAVNDYSDANEQGSNNSYLNPQTRQMLDSLKDNLSTEGDKTTLIGDNYKIIANAQKKTFSISRTEEKTLLVRKNLNNNQIEINRGLTDNDVQQWKEINRLLPGSGEREEITPPQNNKDNDIEQ